MSETLAYIESGIWIAQGIGENDKFYENSKGFIDENVETGSIKGVVSLFSLMEAINVIRNRVTAYENKVLLNGMSNERRKEHLKNITDIKIGTLLKYLRLKETEKKILFADFSLVDMKKIFDDSFHFSRRYFGNIRFYYKCGRCWQDYQHYQYKGLGSMDILHALLAKEYYCDLFITTDNDYRDLQGSVLFPDLHFEVLSPSPSA